MTRAQPKTHDKSWIIQISSGIKCRLIIPFRIINSTARECRLNEYERKKKACYFHVESESLTNADSVRRKWKQCSALNAAGLFWLPHFARNYKNNLRNEPDPEAGQHSRTRNEIVWKFSLTRGKKPLSFSQKSIFSMNEKKIQLKYENEKRERYKTNGQKLLWIIYELPHTVKFACAFYSSSFRARHNMLLVWSMRWTG